MKRYTIASYGDDFYTGRTASGQLALLGLLAPTLRVISFDSEGTYQSYQRIELAVPPELNSFEVYDIYTPEFQAALQQELEQLRHDLGFIETPIVVFPFQVDALAIGIEPLPDHLADFLEDPSVAQDEEEAAQFRERIAEWEQAGKFVLWWGKDYWFGPEGEVLST